jgi:hypothetical protein
MMYRILLIVVAIVLLPACRLEIEAPAGGQVATESGNYTCSELSSCTIEVSDTGFNETFVATPADGYQFIGWKRGYARLCGGSLNPCAIDTSWFSRYENMMELLASDSIGYLKPDFIPSDHIRSYKTGDIVTYSGTVSLWSRGELSRMTAVTVRQDYLSGSYSYLDKNVLTLRTTVTFLDNGEKQVSEQYIWQESNGKLFELTDEYLNDYVTDSAFNKGLLSIPVPLLSYYDALIDFYTMYGGPVSGPVTQGVRAISVSGPVTVDVPMGEYQSYRVTQKDSYEYFFTYVDNKNGSTVSIDRSLWMSAAKGLVKKNEVKREYSRSGALESEARWELGAVRVNF